MSYIKNWFEEHIDELSNEDLFNYGYSEDEIEFLRECFSIMGQES